MPKQVDAMTFEDAADLAGVSRTTWISHRRAGAPRPTAATPAARRRWLASYAAWRTERGKVDSREAAVGDGAATQEAQRWNVEWKKARVASLLQEMRVRRGELVSREDVVEFAGRACAAVAARLQAMVARVPEDSRAIVRAEVRAALLDLSRGLTMTDTNAEVDATAAP
jgi:hypothetical protein